MTATLLFGVCKASFSEDFCLEGSQLFLVDPNQDGTCPDVLPTVHTEDEEDKNWCEKVIVTLLSNFRFERDSSKTTKFSRKVKLHYGCN